MSDAALRARLLPKFPPPSRIYHSPDRAAQPEEPMAQSWAAGEKL